MSGERSTKVAHRIARFEIAVNDLRATRAFYASLFGWKIRSDDPERYGLVETGDEIDGVIFRAERGVPTFVTVYVEVADIDEHLEKAERLGGVVYVPPTPSPFPGEEMFAVFGDPEGNLVGLVQPAHPQVLP